MTNLRKRPYCSHASAVLTSFVPGLFVDASCPCCGLEWKRIPYKRIAEIVANAEVMLKEEA